MRSRTYANGVDGQLCDILISHSQLLGTQGFIDDLASNGIQLLAHSGTGAVAYSLRPLGQSQKNGPHLDICIAAIKHDNVTMRYVSYPQFHRRFVWKPGRKPHWRFLRFGSTHVVAPENFDAYPHWG